MPCLSLPAFHTFCNITFFFFEMSVNSDVGWNFCRKSPFCRIIHRKILISGDKGGLDWSYILKLTPVLWLSLSAHSEEGYQLQPVVADPSPREWILLRVFTCSRIVWLSSQHAAFVPENLSQKPCVVRFCDWARIVMHGNDTCSCCLFLQTSCGSIFLEVIFCVKQKAVINGCHSSCFSEVRWLTF